MTRKYIAIIPAAGLGTRFLPVTRAVPKELLPVGCRPAIQFTLEELAEAGIFDVVMVIRPEKELLRRYCEAEEIGYDRLVRDNSEIKELQSFMRRFRFHWVMQHKPKGLGHAVLCAADVLPGAWPLIMLPDMIIDSRGVTRGNLISEPCSREGGAQQALPVGGATRAPIIDHSPNCVEQLRSASDAIGRAVIVTHRVPRHQLSRYGVLDVRTTANPKLSSVAHIIEKPVPEKAPSDLVVTGRYLLPPAIFGYLEETGRGHGGEIQLTDALNILAGREGLDALEYDGVTFDTGEPEGWLAANLHFSEK